MIVLVLLILTSVALAALFLAAFIWAVRSGQYDDICTPSMRLLTDEPPCPRTENDPLTQSNPKNP
jgi:cbb3-type cytochrome oxidase maturation protein